MEQETQQSSHRSHIARLERAFEGLVSSIEMAIQSSPVQGTGKLLTKSYQALHRKASELLPDDDYITEGLALEVEEGAPEKERLAQLLVAARQLHTYLRSHLPANDFDLDFSDLRDALPGITADLGRKAHKFAAKARQFEARAEARARKLEQHARRMEARMEEQARRWEDRSRRWEERAHRWQNKHKRDSDFFDDSSRFDEFFEDQPPAFQ